VSLPEFPTITPALSREDAINQIISSIAMEELGVSHIINAEGEKLQYVLGTIPGMSGPSATIEDVLRVNESVRAVLQHATENQTLLRSKLQQALTSGVLTGPTGPEGPQGPATIEVNTDVEPLGPDDLPTVANIGEENDVILKFGLPKGATGATGATGTFAAYGTYISIPAGAGSVASGASIQWTDFLSEAPIGMEAGLPSTTVNLTTAGVYRIDYRTIVGSVATGANASVELMLGGAAVPKSAILVTDNIEIAGVAVVSTVTADTTVALRVTGNLIYLAPGTSAFLDIMKLRS